MKTPDLFVAALVIMGLLCAGCFSATEQPVNQPGAAATSAGDSRPSAQPSVVPAVSMTAVPGETEPGPSALRADPQLTTIARMTGGSGQTSKNITVPDSYWELWYTADPLATGGQDIHSGSGSQSALFPKLTIQITDTHTGKVIDTLEPPGGLDKELWRQSDPRPWSTKFYGGNTEYTFLVTATYVESFTLEVRVVKT